MKTTIIITLSAALIAAAPAVFAQGVPSKTPGLQHGVSKKKHSGVSVPVYALPRRREWHVSLPQHDQAAYVMQIWCSQQVDVDAEQRSTGTSRSCTIACNPT